MDATSSKGMWWVPRRSVDLSFILPEDLLVNGQKVGKHLGKLGRHLGRLFAQRDSVGSDG